MSKPSTPSNEPIDPLCWVLAALVSGLVFIRWWQPAEGTIQGDTLGVVLAWFVVLALVGWIGLRGAVWSIHCDGMQWAVWLLAGGHLLSGGLVLMTSGDKRSALNLMWEWLALAIAFPLLRLVLGAVAARREWTVIALGAIVTLSSYGLIQQVFIYPQTIAEYRQVRDDLDAAERSAAASRPDGPTYQIRTRIQTLQSRLLKQGLQPHMLAGSSRATFEGRLLHSTEILGRFALANTFAGLLLVWFVILILQTGKLFRDTFLARVDLPSRAPTENPNATRSGIRYAHFAVLACCTGLVGYCLLLTKSRTAYLATAASLSAWTLFAGLQSRPRGRQILVWGVIGLFGLVALVVIAGMTGGLDQLVLTEASKSLQYRLEYWWSSLQVIREAPLLGIGPGQFRQHYLVHKLPRSSEEIADPHNLFLDVWANGGLLALIGLIWLIIELFRSAAPIKPVKPGDFSKPSNQFPSIPVATITLAPTASVPQPISIGASVRELDTASRQVRKISQSAIPHSSDAQRKGIGTTSSELIYGRGWSHPLRYGALASLLVLWLAGGMLEMPLVILAISWAICIALLDRCLPESAPGIDCWLAAACGLLIHLLGAGGIAMPAMTQLLITIALLSQSSGAAKDLKQQPERSDLSEPPPHSPQTTTAGIVAQAISRRSNRISNWASGIAVALGLGLFAGCFFSAAQPVWLSVANLEQGDLSNSPQKRDQFYRQAAAADPLSAEPWEKIGSMAFAKWRLAQHPDPRDFQGAVTAQQAAIVRNPLAYHGYRMLGEYFLARARDTDSAQDKQAAAAAFHLALKRYPHHAELNAIAAESFHLAGENESAAVAATQALRQDDINHAAQHSDKYLTPELRSRVEAFQTGSKTASP